MTLGELDSAHRPVGEHLTVGCDQRDHVRRVGCDERLTGLVGQRECRLEEGTRRSRIAARAAQPSPLEVDAGGGHTAAAIQVGRVVEKRVALVELSA